MQGQLLSGNVERFRGGLVFKAHRLLYHSPLGFRVIKKKKKKKTSNLAQSSQWSRWPNSALLPQAKSGKSVILLPKGLIRGAHYRKKSYVAPAQSLVFACSNPEGIREGGCWRVCRRNVASECFLQVLPRASVRVPAKVSQLHTTGQHFRGMFWRR